MEFETEEKHEAYLQGNEPRGNRQLSEFAMGMTASCLERGVAELLRMTALRQCNSLRMRWEPISKVLIGGLSLPFWTGRPRGYLLVLSSMSSKWADCSVIPDAAAEIVL
jgi:hypothetical protein